MPLVQQAKKNWDKIAKQTQMEQNRRGDDPKEGEEALAAQIRAGRSRRSYGEFLRKFAVWQEELHADPDEFDLGFYSYGLRHYGNMPLIEPVETREACKIREIVIVLDTSDSTSGDLIRGFLKETFEILSQKNSFFETCSIRILQCDNQVRRDETITDSSQLSRFLNGFTIAGGGGTDFRPAFSYVEKLRQQGELEHLGGLLYFTDGLGTYPEKRPDYRTAFLFLEEYDYDAAAVPPWAMRLQLEPEEWMHEH
jgi:predicted metal-dependent peptidase